VGKGKPDERSKEGGGRWKENENEKDSREIPFPQHPTPSSSFNNLSNSSCLLFFSTSFY
jgi:hypothetical protein